MERKRIVWKDRGREKELINRERRKIGGDETQKRHTRLKKKVRG